VDEDEHQQTQMGETSRFWEPIHPVMDYTAKGPIIRFFMNLGKIGVWKNLRISVWSNLFD
jgi:hypothetical protein